MGNVLGCPTPGNSPKPRRSYQQLAADSAAPSESSPVPTSIEMRRPVDSESAWTEAPVYPSLDAAGYVDEQLVVHAEVPAEEERSAVPRWLPPPPDGRYGILLFGETGSGKSTLVNAMHNFCLGVSRPDEARVVILTRFHHPGDYPDSSP